MDKKIDINGSVADSAKGIITDACGVICVLAIIGCLFAPCFSSMFKMELERPNGESLPLTYDYSIIQRKMMWINIGLWTLCLLSWASLLWLADHAKFTY